MSDKLEKLEKALKMMKSRRVSPIHQPAHEKDIAAFERQLGREKEKGSNRTVVTSENREEFMKKKLKLADKEKAVYDKEDDDQPKFGVKYINSKGEEEAVKHFDDESKAKAYMERGNKLDKVGGKYSFHKMGQ